MQKSSGCGIGITGSTRWRISADFSGSLAEGFPHRVDLHPRAADWRATGGNNARRRSNPADASPDNIGSSSLPSGMRWRAANSSWTRQVQSVWQRQGAWRWQKIKCLGLQ
jgi:hypothetical protein